MAAQYYPPFPGDDGGAGPIAYQTPPHPPYSPGGQQSTAYPYPPPPPGNHRQLAPAPYAPLQQQLEAALQDETPNKRRKTARAQVAGQAAFQVNIDSQAASGAEVGGVADGDDEDGDAEAIVEDDPNEDNTPPDGMYFLAPPPQRVYKSYEECHAAMHEWNKAHGFDVSRQKPAKNKNGDVYKYLYQCTRHGRRGNKHKINEAERKRKRESKKTGCPMGIYIRAIEVKNPAGKWRISHQQDGRSKWHNHEAIIAEELTGHRRRNRTDEMKALIKQTRAAGMDAWQSLAYIKEKIPGALITKQDVLNYRKADPGPESDTHNYLDRAYILGLSFECDFESDPTYGEQILGNIRTRMPISICSKIDSLPGHVLKNPPKVILVPDSALTFPAYRLQLARLVTYTQDGGTTLFLGNFHATPSEYLNNMFLQHFNLDWHGVDLTQTPISYSLNDKLEAGGSGGRWVVIARNFAPGTDAKGIEQLVGLSKGSPVLLSCRLFSQHPTVTAELIFGSQDGAQAVISTFSGQSVNLGRVQTAEGKELEFVLKAPAPMSTTELAPEILVRANALRGVNAEDSVYMGTTPMNDGGHPGGYVNGIWQNPQPGREVSVQLTAAAYAKVGKGYVGYVGSVDFDENYLNLVAAMCHF